MLSVGGLGNNRKFFGPLIPGVDHLRHTLDLERNRFSRGLPVHGAELADDLERLVQLHDASTIAAVIVEPISGSAGVVLPPVGYLQRLRELCTKHNALLIFDEVITGFGRVGKAFAAERFGVTPDLITTAKGLTNGCVPMGAVFVSSKVHEAFMQGPEGMIDLFHGYTYSGHPLACAAALATLDTYQEENLFEKAIELGQYWEDGLHSLRDLPLFLAYCRDSETYSEGNLCDELPLFHAAALKVAIRQYPCGDELTTQMLADMDAWMMERVTGIPSHAEESVTVSRGEWN